MAKSPPKASNDEPSETALDRLSAIAEQAEFDPSTLAGDIRDTLLEIFKHRPKPWLAMTEEEQQDVGRALEYASREIVGKAVHGIRSEGFESPVRAILEGYTDKGDVKATLKIKTMDDEDANHAIMTLHRARGKMVLITIASPDDYLGERRPFEAAPDQEGLRFEAGEDDEAEFEEVD